MRGLSQFKLGKFTNYTTRSGLSSNVITALFEQRPGVLLIGTQDGGLNRLAGGEILQFSASLGLPNAIYGLLDGGNGNLWIASSSGIAQVRRTDLDSLSQKNHALVQYTTADGLRVNQCSEGHPSAWRTRDGSLWFPLFGASQR